MRPEHWLYSLPLRFRSLFRRNRVEQELDEEMRYHLEQKAAQHIGRGMTPEEARYAALRDMDGIEQRKEECRDMRRTRFLEDFLQDLRYAARGFRRAPTFVLTVVTTIALGLGIFTALFTVLNAYYFRPLSVHDPHSLYEPYWVDRTGNGHDFTWPEFQEFVRENPAFSDALAYRHAEARVDGRHLSGILVTADYFRILGVSAAFGRTLLREDAAIAGREPVIVLSYSAWQHQFAGDPGILGKKVLFRGYPFEVVGVAPSGFNGFGARPTDFWAPLTMAARFEGGPELFGLEHPRLLGIVGRLKRGFSVRQAQSGLTAWAQRFTANGRNDERAAGAVLVSSATPKPLNLKNMLAFTVILVAFAVVLLIGCANVANMMLARGISRQREIGIRLSLGATRSRLIRQLLTESVLLALPAAAIGFAVSQTAIQICMRVMFATLPPGIAGFLTRIPQLSLDLRVFGFGFAAALLSALIFGLAPALQSTRTDVSQVAKGEFTNALRPARLRNTLVVGQVTVCVLLLITAAILLRGVNRIQILSTGLSTRDAIEIQIQEKSRAGVLDRLATEPGVQTLAGGAISPVVRKPIVSVMAAEGGGVLSIAVNGVSPEYFTIFELPIVRGRNFTAEEARAESPVAVISQATADRLWPNQEAVGRSLCLVTEQRTEASLRRFEVVSVIGVTRDEISGFLEGGEQKTLVYFPRNPRAAGSKLFVRVDGDTAAALRKLDADLTAIDPHAVEEISRLQIQEWVNEEAYTFRLLYWGSSVIGVLALILTLSGIYGVLSFLVSQRTKEIGIRMAMGATTYAVSGLVLKQAMRLGILGTALGGLLALGVSKALASVLVVISTFDWVAFVGGALLVLAACAAAAYFPSRRASRVDPMVALRYE